MKNLLLIFLFIATRQLVIGQIWYTINVPTTNHLNDIEFSSSTVGYIGGDNETLLKTTNGGASWLEIIPTGIGGGIAYDILDLEFVSDEIGFCTTTNTAGIFKTLDGGVNWTPINDFMLQDFCRSKTLYVKSETEYFAGGSFCFDGAAIKKNDNDIWSEATINREFTSPSKYVKQIDFIGDLGLAVTNARNILRSVDAGVTWDTILTPLSQSGVLTSLVMISADTAYAAYSDNGAGFGLLLSIDGGLSWDFDLTMANFYYPEYFSLGVANNGDLYSGAYASNVNEYLIFERNKENPWRATSVDEELRAIDSYGEDVVFAVGKNGYVITNTNLLALSTKSVQKVEMKAFPNPTQNQIQITCQNIGVDLPVVFSSRGSIVFAPIEVNERGFLIDLSRLVNGVYTVRVQTSQGFDTLSLVKK